MFLCKIVQGAQYAPANFGELTSSILEENLVQYITMKNNAPKTEQYRRITKNGKFIPQTYL